MHGLVQSFVYIVLMTVNGWPCEPLLFRKRGPLVELVERIAKMGVQQWVWVSDIFEVDVAGAASAVHYPDPTVVAGSFFEAFEEIFATPQGGGGHRVALEHIWKLIQTVPRIHRGKDAALVGSMPG